MTQVMKENDREGGLILATGEIFKVFASLNKRRKRYALLRLRRCLFLTLEIGLFVVSSDN